MHACFLSNGNLMEIEYFIPLIAGEELTDTDGEAPEELYRYWQHVPTTFQRLREQEVRRIIYVL
jgi:hypothetical protein